MARHLLCQKASDCVEARLARSQKGDAMLLIMGVIWTATLGAGVVLVLAAASS